MSHQKLFINYIYRQTIQKNNGQIIKNTTADIKKLSSIVKFSHSSNDKTHQLMLEKIISEFHSIAEKYLQSEKNLTLRMKKTLLVNLDESSDEDVNSSQQKHLLQANATAEIQNSLFLDREQQFQNIEKDVNDINQIMNEISTLIQGKREISRF